ncbi:MAG TPA: ATP-binding cassette domain-containing protein, partial [Pirellulales bacterium]|nr:ATP-binding cassette domain-containing protein [Pirellulales bacterium]
TSFAHLLGTIYDIRFEIYQRKFAVKFLNNTLNAATPFFFFLIGGYLVIKGSLSAGSLVAVLSAYKELASPWKELLDYYQNFQDTKIKYDQVVEQFQPDGMLDRHLLFEEPAEIPHFGNEFSLSGVSLVEDGHTRVVDGVTATISLGRPVAVVGANGGGKQELALLLARLIAPTAGRIAIDGADLASLPTSVLGRRMTYLGPSPYLFTQSLGENLLASLKYRPLRAPQDATPHATKREARLRETRRAGNIEFDIEADWIDYEAAGVAGPDELAARMIEILRMVDLDQDVYLLGLRSQIESHAAPAVRNNLLEARRLLHERLATDGLTHLVEPFDAERYNSNASVAENLLFGTPVGPAFDKDNLASNTYVQRILDKTGLTQDLLACGVTIAETMIEIFADGAPSDEFIAQYSFIGADELPAFQNILMRLAKVKAAESRF